MPRPERAFRGIVQADTGGMSYGAKERLALERPEAMSALISVHRAEGAALQSHFLRR